VHVDGVTLGAPAGSRQAAAAREACRQFMVGQGGMIGQSQPPA
jgi:hypothetical protein